MLYLLFGSDTFRFLPNEKKKARTTFGQVEKYAGLLRALVVRGFMEEQKAFETLNFSLEGRFEEVVGGGK